MRERHSAIETRFACSPEAVILNFVEQFPPLLLWVRQKPEELIPGVDVLGRRTLDLELGLTMSRD
jgi:hypothetical protein